MGLEPTRIAPWDFKSHAAAITPLRDMATGKGIGPLDACVLTFLNIIIIEKLLYKIHNQKLMCCDVDSESFLFPLR